MEIETEEIIMLKKYILIATYSLLMISTGCIPYDKYYLNSLVEQSLLPSPNISISNPKKEMELEVSGGINYNSKTQTSFKDSAQNTDPSLLTDNIQINLNDLSYNFGFNLNTGKVIDISARYQGGNINSYHYHNLSFSLGGRFHYKYVGGLISGILMYSNYDIDVILTHFWSDGYSSSQSEAYLDTYEEWKPSLGLNVLINSTEELIPIGMFLNFQFLTLRIFEYEEVSVDKYLMTPSIGLYKNIGNFRLLSSANLNFLQIGDTSEYSVFPSFSLQMSYTFNFEKYFSK